VIVRLRQVGLWCPSAISLLCRSNCNKRCTH